LERRETEISFNFSLVKGQLILVKPVIMKHPSVYNLSIVAVALFLWTNQTSARPIGFSEISLLVRAHESEASIKDEVTQRKLLHALSPVQENILKSQGASDSLIQSLHNSNLVVSKEEAAELEAQRDQKAKAAQVGASGPSETAEGKLYVFDVALGHPINLSQWGGYDYELAFYSYRCAGEDIIEPALIDNVRTVSVATRLIPTGGLSEHEAFAEDSGFTRDFYQRQRFTSYDSNEHRFTPYDARRDLKDDRFNFGDTVSVSSRSASRPLAIDRNSPVTIKGVPYALYPVYGAGGVSLYYIGSSSDSVKLAVSTVNQ
jgi:hypothetical protein